MQILTKKEKMILIACMFMLSLGLMFNQNNEKTSEAQKTISIHSPENTLENS